MLVGRVIVGDVHASDTGEGTVKSDSQTEIKIMLGVCKTICRILLLLLENAHSSPYS